jgi:hypothetical protein
VMMVLRPEGIVTRAMVAYLSPRHLLRRKPAQEALHGG